MTWARWVRRAALRHPGRSAISMTSIVLGVAIYLGVSIGARTLSQALEPRGTLGIPSNAALLLPTGVWGAEAPASAADPIRELPDVVAVIVTYQVPGPTTLTTRAGTADVDTPAVFLYGTELAGTAAMAKGKAPRPGRDEIVVPADLATSLDIDVGDRVSLTSATGAHAATVSGVFPAVSRTDTSAQGGVATSLATAHRWADRGDVISNAYVQLRAGVDGIAWTTRHRLDLGALQPAGFTVFQSTAVEFFRAIEDSLQPVATAALVLGGYLIFLTISRTVHDRRGVHGALRAVGASRRRVVGLVLAEAALIGAVGTALGIVVGLGISRGVAEVMGRAFSVSLAATPGFSAPPDVLAIAVALGMLTPLASATLPALRAASADPADALRGAATDQGPRASSAVGGVAVFAAGFALTAGLSERLKPLGAAVSLGGVVLVAPVAARALAATARPGLERLALAGELSARRLARRPGRSATTAGLLATTLALVIVVSSLEESGHPGFARVVETNLGADLVVGDYSNVGLAPGTIDRVAATRGVAAISASAEGRVETLDPGGRTEFLRAIDPATYFDVADFSWTSDTDAGAARRAIARGGSVILETTIAARIHRRPGDSITVQALDGRRRLAIAGTYVGLGYGDSHAVVVSLRDARAHFGLERPTRLLVDLAPGADEQATTDLVRAQLGDVVSVRRNTFARAEILQQFTEVWGLVRLVVIVTAAIGLLGLVNTMLMEIFDRRHELGVLRALGAERRDVGRLVALEAVFLGATAGIVGIVAGSLIGWASVSGVERITRVPVSFRYPLGAVPLVVVLALLAGAAAAVLPARRAAALDPADVLRST
jgi:putative ABC transport system permease protein